MAAPLGAGQPGVRVRKTTRNGSWLVYCDICDPGLFGIAFMPIRKAPEHWLAVTWAHQHARKHAEAMCPVCQHMEPIKDESTRVTEEIA